MLRSLLSRAPLGRGPAPAPAASATTAGARRALSVNTMHALLKRPDWAPTGVEWTPPRWRRRRAPPEAKLAPSRPLNFHVGKLKDPTKRAGGLMAQLHEDLTRGTKPRERAMEARAGDSVEVLYKDSMSQERPTIATGVITGITKPRSYDATMRVLGVVGTTRLEWLFPLHAPTLVDVRVLQKAFTRKGKRRERRAKLFHLKDEPLSSFRVGNSRQTIEEREKLVASRRKAREAAAAAGGAPKKGAPKKKA